MSVEIPDLWSEKIRYSGVVTPFTILSFQAGRLRERTAGILEGEVVVETDDEKEQAKIYFDIHAPALSYRYRLFAVEHGSQLVYPALLRWYHRSESEYAADEQLFTQAVSRMLAHVETISVIQSLIARSNDILSSKEGA